MNSRENHLAEATNYELVQTDISCLLTRFKVRSPIALIRFFIHFRRIKKQSKSIKGLVTSVFLMEDLFTCYTLSIWKNAHESILNFNVVATDHIHAANASFRDLKTTGRKPLLWSAQFQLSAVSPHNFRWEGVDFGSLDCAAGYQRPGGARSE